jgi:hypothetical protein
LGVLIFFHHICGEKRRLRVDPYNLMQVMLTQEKIKLAV